MSSSVLEVALSAAGALELPLAQEMIAAMTQAMTAKINASRMPEAKGTEINLGKKPRPVSATTSLWGIWAIADGPKSLAIGLYPSSAEKRTDTGGTCERLLAAANLTPCAVRPLVSADGRVAESPAIINEKKIPIENT